MHGKLVNPDSEREILQERKGYPDQKLQLFADYFAPKTIGEFNGHYVMLTKPKGQFIWRKHDDTDDFFLVLLGTLEIELRDRTVTLGLVRCKSSRKESSTVQLRVKRCRCCSSSRAAQPTLVIETLPPRAS